MTHPAQHHVDASKKRQRAWVEGRARGGKVDRPGKNGALRGGASEDGESMSTSLPPIKHVRSGKFPVPDTVGGAEGQMDRARGGEIARTPSGSVKASARHKAEAAHETMPGGSFPIRNAADLANAKHDVGRAKDPAAARRWIDKRARELGEPPLGG